MFWVVTIPTVYFFILFFVTKRTGKNVETLNFQFFFSFFFLRFRFHGWLNKIVTINNKKKYDFIIHLTTQFFFNLRIAKYLQQALAFLMVFKFEFFQQNPESLRRAYKNCKINISTIGRYTKKNVLFITFKYNSVLEQQQKNC